MINKTEKKVTVIIPSKTYDVNLKHCIKKIRLFYKKIKIILVLDEKKAFIKDKNIKIISSGSKTIGYKRNIGVNLSKTPFVAFIDSDAYPNSRWLDFILDTFKKDKKAVVVGGPNLSPKTNNIEKKLVANSRKLSFVTLNSLVKFKSNKTFKVTFLPSVNIVIKKNVYKKIGGMNISLNTFEDLSLMYALKKHKYKILFNGNAYVFHKDRNFKNFFRQRLVYGSDSLKIFFMYPCKETLLALFSLSPFLFILTFPLIFLNYLLFYMYFSTIFGLFIFCIINSYKINFSGNFFKSLKLTLISVFGPGIGFFISIFSNSKNIRKIYTQR